MAGELTLQHVVLWKNGCEHPVTPDNYEKDYTPAERNNPRFKQNLYCQLCRERVVFCGETSVYYPLGDCYGTRSAHFKHSNRKHDEYCPERSKGTSNASGAGWTSEREFPLRLALNRSWPSASFELGIPCPPSKLLEEAPRGRLKLLNDATGKEAFVYDFASLFGRRGMNYITLGRIGAEARFADQPLARYRLKLEGCSSDAANKLLNYWGISATNPFLYGVSDRALNLWFDAKNGRKLPTDSVVYVGREYYLLTRRAVYEIQTDADGAAVEIEFIGRFEFSGEVALCKVKPLATDDATRRFFWRYSCSLKAKTPRLIEVWPPSATDGAVVRTCDYYGFAYFYFAGECQINEEIYPKTSRTGCLQIDKSKTRGFLRIGKDANWGKIALLAQGESSVLHYAMIWRDRLNFTAETPTVAFVDPDDPTTRFDDETAKTLPARREIRVDFPFDGVLEIRRKGALAERRELKAGAASTTVREVDWRTTLTVWQGRDCVRTLRFERESDTTSTDALSDRDLARALRSQQGGATVGFSRTHAAALASRLGGAYPATKTWLRQAAQRGEIAQEALVILKGGGKKNARVAIN
ncbi:MAG: hypothetical protein IKU86_13640 [Thermoguttaceae bacterium]|nr:hypothetical protein [Thermoguttaceae bacterium]